MKWTLYIIVLFTLISCNRNMDKQLVSAPANVMSSDAKSQFPTDWLGYWTGELHIYNETGETMTIPMALDNGRLFLERIL